MGNALSKNSFSLPTFEEALRMNDSFASFLCPYCGKWHRAEKETNKYDFKKNVIDISTPYDDIGILSVTCPNPLYFSSDMSYKAYFGKDSIYYKVVPLSANPNSTICRSWLNHNNCKIFSGEVPYSSFHVLPDYTSDMAEIKYVFDIKFRSLREVCGAHDFRGCTDKCYFSNCDEEKRIQLGFGLKYDPGATILDIDTRLKRVIYKYLEQLPKKVLVMKYNDYMPLLGLTRGVTNEKDSVATYQDIFDNWCRMEPEGSNWLYHFIQELLDTALIDEYDKEEALTDILDLKL